MSKRPANLPGGQMNKSSCSIIGTSRPIENGGKLPHSRTIARQFAHQPSGTLSAALDNSPRVGKEIYVLR
ncbi:MAG TPA: hypothetical protein VN777_02925 [Terriglobales bacterium]|nr:hypothetical protein [Terriglobales bacterium]